MKYFLETMLIQLYGRQEYTNLNAPTRNKIFIIQQFFAKKQSSA